MDPLNSEEMTGLRLPSSLWSQMRDEVERCAPEEACGLVAGKDGRAHRVIPVENELHSPVNYRMEPQAQVTALLEIETTGLALAAIYHSHPTGPAYPSQTDIAQAYYPEAVYLIWSQPQSNWICKAFLINNMEEVIEVPLAIEQD